MDVIALIEPADREARAAGEGLREASASGATYEQARDAVEIPDGWRLVGWFVPDHHN